MLRMWQERHASMRLFVPEAGVDGWRTCHRGVESSADQLCDVDDVGGLVFKP